MHFSPLVRFSLISLLAWQALTAAAFAQPRTEDKQFTAKCDGSGQHYVVIYPEEYQAERTCDVLIALHGHGSDRWQFVKTDYDEARAARDAAAARRMIYVSPDYRAKTSWMGPKAEADLVQIIEEMKSRHKIGKVILCGGSMGGSSSLTFAALHPELIDGVVAMNGTANHLEYEMFQDAIQESFGGTKKQIPLEYKKRSAEYWPERLSMPIAITAGGKDTIVPPQSVLRLADVLKKLQPNVLLIFREEGEHRTFYPDAKQAFDFVLDKALQTSSQVLPAKEVKKYSDGRPAAQFRLDAEDQGVVLRHGDGPEECDRLGARDVWVYPSGDTFYMHYFEESNKTWFLFTNHIGVDERGEYTDAVWVYWTQDLNRWNADQKAVVLDGGNCKWSSDCIGLPSVVQVGRRLAVFYDAPGGKSVSHVQRDVGLAWLNLPLVLPAQSQSAAR